MIITDWYWQYGINRTGEYQLDASWLDAVSRLENKRSRILDSMNQKTCLALWGMSQTGKSTLLSQYLDGRRANGNDSALTWRVFVVAGAMTDKTKTRKENQK